MTRIVPKGCPLSQRQYEVMTLLAEGLTQRQTAQVLGIDRSTVSNHCLQAQWILGAQNQRSAVSVFAKRWWPDAPRDYSGMRGEAA